jgi:hypothetical protein
MECQTLGRVGLLLACAGWGCSRERADPRLGVAAETTSVAPKETAESQFARFLSLSIATRETNRAKVDSVYTDGDIKVGGDVAPCLAGDEAVSRWLADYHVLSVSSRGDTAIASAAITTAVREEAEPDGQSFVATPLIQEDTARWMLVRGADTHGKWMVCGPGASGQGFFALFKVGRTIRWANGGSARSAMATIDSIRRARSLPIAR